MGHESELCSLVLARPGEHFVDKHRSSLFFLFFKDPEVPILDKLLEHSIMSKEDYDSIMAKHDPQDLTQHLRSSGT